MYEVSNNSYQNASSMLYRGLAADGILDTDTFFLKVFINQLLSLLLFP